MRVRAIRTGYFGHRRQRVGEVFELPPEACKKGPGGPILPSWVEAVDKVPAAAPAKSQEKQPQTPPPAGGQGQNVL